MAKHTILGGKVHVYQRDGSQYWQCATYLAGRNRRVSTKEESLSRAKDFAEDWYLELRAKYRLGDLRNEKTFKQAAEVFKQEYEIITEGLRSPVYVETVMRRLRLYLVPYFGDKGLSEVTPGAVQDYRIWRLDKSANGNPPSRSSMHQEIVALRQVLKTAIRHGWMTHLPDLSMPYKTAGKIAHRGWFSHDEYKRLYEATRRRARETVGTKHEWHYAQLHDFVLLMANTGLRPDEIKRLQYRDVSIVHDEDTDETILEIEVRGKRGVGYCKSTPGAVRPFERMHTRNNPQPSDLLFKVSHRGIFNKILAAEDLKVDREDNQRTAYSLRHTYICFRLMEGADIYQIAKNCRTSVEMIEKYYASHIKNSLNAAAINVRRQKPRRVEEV